MENNTNNNADILNLYIEKYLEFWTKGFTDFSSRATRLDFNVPLIFHTLIYILFMFVETHFFILSLLFLLASLVPSISITIRRLVDLKLNKFLVLIFFIPVISLLFTIYLMLAKSKE